MTATAGAEPAAPSGGAAAAGPDVPLKPSLGRLFKNASLFGIGQAASSVIGFVTNPILSHFLTRADYGLIDLTRSAQGLLSAFTRLGLDSAANRFYYEVERDPARSRLVIGTLNAGVLVWAILITVAQEIFGPALYARYLPGIPYEVYGRFVAFTLLVGALAAIPQALWGAQEKAARIAGLNVLATLLWSTIALGLVVGPRLGAVSVFWASLLSPLITLPILLRFGYGRFGLSWHWDTLKRGLAFGVPMVVHLGSHWVLNAIDRPLIDHYLGREAVGLYGVAYGTTSTLIMINLSINQAYVPQFTRTQGDPAQKSFVARAVTYFLVVSGAAVFAHATVSPSVIRIFYARAFHDAAPLVPVLCIAPLFQAVYLIYVGGLFFAKKAGRIPIFTVLAGCSNIGLNVLFIPRFGLMGAAFATVGSYVALALLFRLACAGVTSIPIEWGRLARGLLPLAALSVGSAAVDLARLPLALEAGAKLVLLVASPFALVASGFLQERERAYLGEQLRKRWPRIAALVSRVWKGMPT